MEYQDPQRARGDSLGAYSSAPSLAMQPDGPPAVPRGGLNMEEKQKHEPLINLMDITAVLVSLLALLLALVTISPSLPYAATWQYTTQIIVVGFLLGVMNQALARVLPYFCLILERRMGSSTLQNYDGLLRWSPVTSQLSLAWRISITLSLALPLVLSVLYKRFTGGVGSLNPTQMGAHFSMTALPGLEDVPGLSIMANATVPYLTTRAAKRRLETFNQTERMPYGYNIISLSNTTAAALDIPIPTVLSRLQAELGLGEAYYLSISVRGTVAEYNEEIEDHRNDDDWWDQYTSVAKLQSMDEYDGNSFGMLNLGVATGNDAELYDDSWIFLGDFPTGDDQDKDGQLKAFQEYAQLLKVRRHDCNGVLKITRATVELTSGDCSPNPLPNQYQYFQNAQIALGSNFLPMLQQSLGSTSDDIPDNSKLTTARARRLIPDYAVIVAAMYQSRVAMMKGTIPIQVAGPIQRYWMTDEYENEHDPHDPTLLDTGGLNETYFVANNTIQKAGPTLRADPSLYVILAIQPILTIIAFVVPLVLMLVRGSPRGGRLIIPHGFNLVAILAGVDRGSLDALSPAKHTGSSNNVALTGTTKQQIDLDIEVENHHLEPDGLLKSSAKHTSVRYRLSNRVSRRARRGLLPKWQEWKRPELQSLVSFDKAVLLEPRSPVR